MHKEFQKELERCQRLVDNRLGEFFGEHTSYSELLVSMRYSLLSGGKRIRAIICMKFCEAVGGKPEAALDAACAIEMLHTYTLIHDDLPCMDDDDVRRGKPSNHIQFGEFTATLAGDAMQAAAFETLLKSDLPPERLVKMALALAKAAGPYGICSGQYLDLAGEGMALEAAELSEINSLKTSALISAAAQIGVIAGGGTLEQVEAADDYAQALGLAFQIRDDVLDCIATEEALGKPIGSDNENKKYTYAVLLGTDECERHILAETDKAIKALEREFVQTDFLKTLAIYLATRQK